MHYVPESSRALLEGDVSLSDGGLPEDSNFHFASAPVYLLTTVVGLLLLGDFVIGTADNPAWTTYRTLFGFRLALLAAVLGGARILYHTLEGLFEGRVGADLALTIACLAAILLGEHSVAALVVFIALVGESIEGYTVDRATRAIRGIFSLCPRVAHVVRAGREQDVQVEQVTPGDEVLVRPGERIPVDGRVVSGTSEIDESALTGESRPVAKTAGSAIFAGTLNHFGAFVVVAEKVGEATTVGQIARMVAEATSRKTPLERTADRLARYFLPIVLLAAGATLIGWRLKTGTWSDGWMKALAVLVVACPCPLVLATPCAVMAAMAWLARNGVVIKGSIALERFAGIDTFAFDKTGTLTRGELDVGDVLPAAGLEPVELLRLAAAAEKPSEHLLARVIVREAEARNVVVPTASEFTASPGSGVVAHVGASVVPEFVRPKSIDHDSNQIKILVGNRRLLAAHGVEVSPEWGDRLAALEESGQSVLLVGLAADKERRRDGELESKAEIDLARFLGMIGVRDAVRPEARAVLEELRDLGVTTFALLTGDRRQAVESVLGAVGTIDHVGAELLPLDKSRWIDEQLRAGRKVAMVGDGVNDAPALAAATVGLALGGVGSDLAAEAGDLVLMGDPLAPLPSLLRLSRQLVQVIRQGIYVFAFGMNGLGVILSAWGLLSPVGGALFHEFASLAVMLNALRLLWFERWETTRLGRVSGACGRCAEALSRSLSPSQAVYNVLIHRQLIVKLAIVAAILWWLTSNFVCLSEAERALVLRCGKYNTTLGAGWHFRWPLPFESIHRREIDRLQALSLGFRTTEAVAAANGAFVPAVEWQAEHGERGYLPVIAESQLLTGDETAVELTAEVHFRIRDLKTWVLRNATPEQALRASAESAIRQVVSRRKLDGLLADARSAVEAECLALLQHTEQHLDLGAEIASFTLLDVHPPPQVVPAYRDVANALEEREQLVNIAEAQHARLVLSAAGEQAVRRLNRSAPGAVADERDSSTTGGIADWSLDDRLWRELTDESQGEMLISGSSAAKLLDARREQTRTIEESRGRQSRFLSLLPVMRIHPFLTRLQLYSETIEQALAARPLTILDPQATGRRQLWLTDPERFSLPVLPQNPAAESGARVPAVPSEQ